MASATATVQEFVEDGVNGTLVDFFDVEALADAVATAAQGRGTDGALRAVARQTVVERCDLRRVAQVDHRVQAGAKKSSIAIGCSSRTPRD